MKYAIIINPVSGNHPIEDTKAIINENFSDYKLYETSKEINGYMLAEQAIDEGYENIIACGGDGTVTEVASAIAYKKKGRLGIIPAGTGNMLAGNLGIPLSIKDSILVIKENTTKKMDIGKVNDKYFTFMMGCGFNSIIIEETSREKKQRFGYLAYFIEGFKKLINPQSIVYQLQLDNKKQKTIRAFSLIIANKANILGETFSLAPDASLFDGKLDLIIVSLKSKLDIYTVLKSILTKKHFEKRSKMKRIRFEKAYITSYPKANVQVDGDILTQTPIEIEVVKEGVEVFIPDKVEPNLINYADENFKKSINMFKQALISNK